MPKHVLDFNDYIAEAGPTPIPLLTVLTNLLANPATVGLSAKENTNLIYLAQRDNKGAIIPGSQYSYKVSGSYDAGALVPTINFDVKLRNVRRSKNGTLFAEAQPTNSIVKAAMLKLIPKENLSADGWLSVQVPSSNVYHAIYKLKNNSGNTALMDVGQGVSINLSRIA